MRENLRAIFITLLFLIWAVRAQAHRVRLPVSTNSSTSPEHCLGVVTDANRSSKLVICDRADGCTHFYVKGQEYKTLDADGLMISVGLVPLLDHRYLPVAVMVKNERTTPADVLLKDFSLQITKPKDKELRLVPGERVAKSEDRSYGKAYKEILDASLSANTLMRSQSTKGIVWFRAGRGIKGVTFCASIAGTIYRFPFAVDGFY